MNVRTRITKIQEGLPLESRVERCARMLAIHFLFGDERYDGTIVARQIAFYRIPKEAVATVINRVRSLVEEENS